jgi:hypothetical protein
LRHPNYAGSEDVACDLRCVHLAPSVDAARSSRLVWCRRCSHIEGHHLCLWVRLCHRRLGLRCEAAARPARERCRRLHRRLGSVVASRPSWCLGVAAARPPRSLDAACPLDRGVATTVPPNMGIAVVTPDQETAAAAHPVQGADAAATAALGVRRRRALSNNRRCRTRLGRPRLLAR